MRPKIITMCVALSVAFSFPAFVLAANVPSPTQDARIRVVTYKPNDVTVVKVQRGVVTRVVLEKDERILVSPVGLSSDCKGERDEWCIEATGNQIFVRPRDNATKNNMEISTNKRDYSILFEVVEDDFSRGKREDKQFGFFRVIFDYPSQKPSQPEMTEAQRAAAVASLVNRIDQTVNRPLSAQADLSYGVSPSKRLKMDAPQIKNAHYTKQVLDKGEDAEPTLVFDDGRFTYFEFPGTREIPAIFAYGSEGEATRVNWHREANFIVVQRLARKFTLRLGNAVVGIFNEAFDRTGLEIPTSTVSPSVVREVKGGVQ